MGKYQAYPEYKDSGIEWLGDIPEHWELWKLNHFAPIITCGVAATPEYVDDGVAFLSAQNVKKQKIDLSKGHKFISKNSHNILTKNRSPKNGDILLSRVGTVGEVCIVDVDFVFSIFVSLTHLRLNQQICKNRFFVYLCQSQYINSLHSSVTLVGGGVGNLNVNDLREYKLPIPPRHEQIKITDFLDHETAKIDTLIDKQQQLIQLLKEKRQAVISHAVTKGLNPNAPMRDSGVEWLGEVPEHWVTGNLRWFIDIASGEGLSNTEIESIEDEGFEFRVVGGNGTMGFTKKANTTEQAFAVGRVGALCGNVHFIDEPCWITDNALKISSWVNFDNEYLYYLLTAARLNDYASRSAQPLITGEQVKALKCPIPPIHEQVEIGRHIQAELEKFEKLISKNERAMNIAKERRTALISAAVTGKIDVRHHASHPTGNDTSEVSA